MLGLSQLGAMLAPVRIHNRIAYSRAQQTGLTAQEFEPEGRAADEIKQLYSFMCMHLYTEAGNSHANPAELTASGS